MGRNVVAIARRLIHDPSFMAAHRSSPSDFTRRRHFSFARVCLLAIQKTVRSTHAHLADFFARLTEERGPGPSSSAWTQARAKLKHTAFIELNRRSILEPVYAPENPVARWRQRRLLAIDTSTLRLPANDAVAGRFGWTTTQNQQGLLGRCVQARLCVLYDLLNQIALDALVTPLSGAERQLAAEQLAQASPRDVIVMDRGFASYHLFARCLRERRDFICRCERSGFVVVRELFARNEAGRSVIASLGPPSRKKAPADSAASISLRFVTVALPNGELEVLATSLLDDEEFPTAEFGNVYQARWGIETYYGRLKGRLDLEHFSGQTLEAVLQDIHATIYLSNLETILIGPAQEQLRERSEAAAHRQQVNHAVAFHALKTQLIELLLSQTPIDGVIAKMQQSFLRSAQLVRPERQAPRRPPKWASYFFQRNVRKSVF